MLATLPPVSHVSPPALHAAPFPATVRPASPATLARADRLARLAARRALIVERCTLLRSGLRHITEPCATFAPVPRQSSRLIDADPLLSTAERLRVRLEVEIARDLELWSLGRATPCYWLTVGAQG